MYRIKILTNNLTQKCIILCSIIIIILLIRLNTNITNVGNLLKTPNQNQSTKVKDIDKKSDDIIVGKKIDDVKSEQKNENTVKVQNTDNKISFDNQIESFYNKRANIYKKSIDKALYTLKDISFDNDLSKTVDVEYIDNFMMEESEFIGIYKEYIENKYKELYSTEYKNLYIFQSAFANGYRLIFKYK